MKKETQREEKLTENDNAEEEVRPDAILAEEDIREKIKTPKSEVQITKIEFAVFMAFSLSLLVVIYLIFETSSHSRINAAIRKEFKGYVMPFDSINTKSDFLAWAKELVTYTYQTTYYIGRNRERAHDSEIAYSNYYVSVIRITQRRMRTKSSYYNDFQNFDPEIWRGPGFDVDSGSTDDEDTSAYGPNSMYTYTDSYEMNGFITLVDIFGNSQEVSVDTMTALENNNWVDNKTRSILVDFVLYNPYVEIYTYVHASLIFRITGGVVSTLDLYNVNKSYYTSKGTDVFRTICEIIFVVLLIVYILQQPLWIYATYRKVKAEIEDETLVEEGYAKACEQAAGVSQRKKSGEGVLSGVSGAMAGKLRLFFWVLYVHFTSLWNVLDMLGIALSFTSFVYWVVFISHQNSYTITTSSFQNPVIIDKLYTASKLLYTNRYICAFNLIIISIRILKYLGFVFERVTVLFGALDRAKSNIFYFLILILTVMFSFILFVFIYFGPNEEIYSSFTRAMTCLFQFMNWWYSSFDDLIDFDIVTGSILFVVFMIVVVFILLNMFVGFLLKSYKEANEELTNRLNGCDDNGKKVVFEITVHWTIKLQKLIYNTLAVVSAKYRVKKEKIEEEHRRFTAILKQTKDESTEFDREYNMLESFSQEKNKLPLTSYYIEEKANLERDRRCGRIFYSTIIFLAFTVIYIVLLSVQLRIGTGHSLVASTQDKVINDPIVQFIDVNSTQEYRLDGIADLEYLTRWISAGMPLIAASITTSNNTFGYLVGDEFKITVRLGQNLHGKSQLDPAFVRLDDDGVLNTAQAKGERTDYIVAKNNNYRYSSDGGYLGYGGYMTYWDANSTLMAGEAANFVADAIVGPDMWMFTVEFVTYTPTVNLFVYNAIIIKTYNSGRIVSELRSNPLHVPESSSSAGSAIIVLEVIFILYLIYYMFDYVTAFIYKWRDYTNWIEAEATYLTSLQLYQRGQKCPEIMRQLKYILNMYRIIDALFFIFSVLSIAYWFAFLSISNGIQRTMPYNHFQYDVHTKARQIADCQHYYINYSSITLIIIAVRLIEYLQYAGNMRIITSTLYNAFEDIVYFVIILLSLMLGFAGMANIAFGEYSDSFWTLGQSWISCFIMIMGEFDISDVLDHDLTLGVIFIFTFLILFSYILLNIFLAILELNFSASKQEIEKRSEKVRKLNVLLCCWLKNPERTAKEDNAEEDILNLPECMAMLDDLNVQVDAVHQSLRWWADGIAKHIQTEMRDRQKLKAHVRDHLVFVDARSLRNEDDPNTLQLAKERKTLFHYLRVACQLFEYQSAAINHKISLLNSEIKEKSEKYFGERRDFYRARKVGEEVKGELVAKVKLIREADAQDEREESQRKDRMMVIEEAKPDDEAAVAIIHEERKSANDSELGPVPQEDSGIVTIDKKQDTADAAAAITADEMKKLEPQAEGEDRRNEEEKSEDQAAVESPSAAVSPEKRDNKKLEEGPASSDRLNGDGKTSGDGEKTAKP